MFVRLRAPLARSTFCRAPVAFYLNQTRSYAILGHGIFRPKQYTKYRITKPFSETTDFEDLYLSEPSRDDLAKMAKMDASFLRFLKFLTDAEDRQDAFKEFARRCEAGLVVEKDVYLTKAELLENLWENGFSEQELNAYDIAFPEDYRFHYPELSVLFDIAELDCYKFCMKARASKPDDLVEIKHKPTPNAIASYGVVSVFVWFGLQNNVLGNMWTIVKTWPFFAVFYMLASHFQKGISAKIHTESTIENVVATENRLDGEDRVYYQMKKFSNDSKCFDFLDGFKPTVTSQLQLYRTSTLNQLQSELEESMTRHLVSVQQHERTIESTLQEVIVDETVAAFNEVLNDEFRNAAFDAAVEALNVEGDAEVVDPVGQFFKKSFGELSGKVPPTSSVVDRVKNREVGKTFSTVLLCRAHEASVLSEKARKSVGGSNLSKLTKEDIDSVEKLYNEIIRRVGLGSLLSKKGLNPLKTQDTLSSQLVQDVNNLVSNINNQLHEARLKSFLKSFA